MLSNLPLAPAAALYGLGMRRRRKRCLQQRAALALPCPIVSIGNLSVGGTGKTPMVQWTAALLQSQGYKVGIVGRGYGGRLSHEGAVVSDGRTIFLNARDAGDEPLLHARHLPGVAVVIGRDRHKAVHLAVQECGVEVVVLDDGFQFWSLPRTLDIVLLDARCPFTNGHLLPRGRLREEPAALTRADAVVLTRSNRATPEQLQAIKARVSAHTLAPVFLAEHTPLDLWDEGEQQSVNLQVLHDRGVSAIAAIADPQDFELQLTQLGARVANRFYRGDHHDWRQEDFGGHLQPPPPSSPAPPALPDLAICTEKDAVKLDPAWFGGRLLSLRIGMKFPEQEAELRGLILSKLKSGQET